MSKPHPIALLACLASLLLFANGARAGVTIDLWFQDEPLPSGITLWPNPGPGCTFTGYYGAVATVGYCMDVILTSDEDLASMQGSVHYDTDNGLSVASFYEWKGVGVSWNAKDGGLEVSCNNMDGIFDTGTQINWFECSLLPPDVNPPSVPAGTYRLGTIIWNLSATFLFDDNQEVLSVVEAIAGVIINGAVVDVTGQIVAGSHIIGIPEPGTAALLGLGFVGLLLTVRRRRPSTP